MTFAQWKNKGRYHQVLQHQLFVVDEGKSEKVLCILHGYPSASYDYLRVLPALTKHFRVLVHDHLGFGLSDKPLNYSYSLFEQAEMTLALWEKSGLKKIHLLAHDYGTSVATEIIARINRGYDKIEIESLTLCNGSILIELSRLRPIQKFLLHPLTGPMVAKMATKSLFVRNMKKLWFDPSRLDLQELEVLWEMLNHKNGKRVMPQLTQYIAERKRFRTRWVGALQNTEIPIIIYWATEDIVAVRLIASTLHKLIPNSTLQWLENTGHYPMLENPEIWANQVISNILELTNN